MSLDGDYERWLRHGYEEEEYRFLYEQLDQQPTDEEVCAGTGHPFYGVEADCEDGKLHADGEPCECGRCYCGFKRYHRSEQRPR